MSQQLIRFYKFEDFLIDVDERSLLRNGVPVSIKPKAFEALLLLVEHREQVLSKEKLMDALWPEADVEPNNVDQQIAALRTALGGQFRNRERYIKTVRGQGFRFIADVKGMAEFQTSQVQQTIMAAASTIQWKPVLAAAILSSLMASVLTGGVVGFLRRSEKNADAMPVMKPLAKANPDGSWIVVVPPVAQGVSLEVDGHPIGLAIGDEIEIVASGIADIGRGPFGPEGEPNYRDSSVDSKYKDHVGGLEMWIGPDKEANRFFIGARFIGKLTHSGVPTFRVVESLPGYKDGNSGAFIVTVKRTSSQQTKP